MHTTTRLAAAIALASSLAAVAEVRLGGEMKIGVASLDFEHLGGRKQLVESASAHIDLYGEEALGDGLTALFDIKTYVCLDGDPKVSDDCLRDGVVADPIGGKEAWVGLRHGDAKLRLGRGRTPLDELTDRYDPSTGLGTGMSAWVETVLPHAVRLEPARAAPLVAALGQAVYARAYAAARGQGAPAAVADAAARQAAAQARGTVDGALAQLAAGLAEATRLPGIARSIEPDGTFDNAIRLDLGTLDGWHASAMYGAGEDAQPGRAGASRLSAGAGYSSGRAGPGQFRIDLVFDQQKQRSVPATVVRGQVAAGLDAARGRLLAGLAQAGVPAGLADGIAAAVFTPALYAPYRYPADNRARHWLLGTSYVFPFGRLDLMVDRIGLTTLAGEMRRSNWALNWETGTDRWGAFVGYRRLGASETAGVGGGDSARKIGAGFEYYLSRRTKLITEVLNNRIEGEKARTGYVGGIVHKF
ncbi:porin [Chitinimonas koreensis]|uniref:porin n=1 Tax=Chitinimonas koreensis TaxID=356302 RepID=UPI000416AFB8|nr:porin [Chitinimonas koreensis]QNM97963.1 porin [Chitinimonas koreensis]